MAAITPTAWERIIIIALPVTVATAIGVLGGIRLVAAEETDGEIGTVVKSYSGAEMIETLQMLASQIRGNYALMRTCIATYEFVDQFYFSGPIPALVFPGSDSVARSNANGTGYWELTRGRIDLEWDLNTDQVHVLYKPNTALEYIDVGSGRRIVRTGAGDKNAGDIYHWIMTPEHWIEFGENVELGQIEDFPACPSVPDTGGRIATRKVRREADGSVRVVNPIALFSNGSQLFWEQLQLYLNALGGNRSADEKNWIEKNVSLVQLNNDGATKFALTAKYPRGESDQRADAIVKTTFDSSVGFEPTSWIRSVGGHVSDKRTFAYREVSDVFVPEHFSYVHYELKNDSPLPTISRTFILKKARINEPIPAGRFEITQLGLKYGERFLDEIENQLYVMDDNGLVPVKTFSMDPARAPRALNLTAERLKTSGGRNWTLIIINVLVVLALIVLVVVRRRKMYAA